MSRGPLLFAAVVAAFPLVGFAAINSISALENAPAERPAAGIMENSFLVDDREWNFAFYQVFLGTEKTPGFAPGFSLILPTGNADIRLGNDAVDGFGGTSRSVSTGIGIAAPVGISFEVPDYGIFLYASFEHFFCRPKTVVAGK